VFLAVCEPGRIRTDDLLIKRWSEAAHDGQVSCANGGYHRPLNVLSHASVGSAKRPD